MENRALTGAGVGRRSVAVVVDLLVMSPVLFLVARAFGHSTVLITPTGRSYNYVMEFPGVVLFTIIIILYHTLLEGQFGRTLGKLVTGVVVVSDDGSPIDFGAALKRNLLRIVDGLFFYLIAAIAVWASSTHQRFGDRWARTMVVQPGSQTALPPAPPPRSDTWSPASR